MYGLNHLRQASAVLDGPPGYVPTPAELSDAFAHVWGAVAFSDGWPSSLRAELAGLIVASRRYGCCADTAHRLSPAEIQEFTTELRRVLAQVMKSPSLQRLPEMVTPLRRATC